MDELADAAPPWPRSEELVDLHEPSADEDLFQGGMRGCPARGGGGGGIAGTATGLGGGGGGILLTLTAGGGAGGQSAIFATTG